MTSNPWEAPQQQGYGAPLPPHGQLPAPPGAHPRPAYGGSQPGWQAPPWQGPRGQVRPTGTSILLFVVTLAIYTYVYNYKIHKEMKEHSGRGVGGGVALLLTFVAGIAMPFVTSAEVGALYARRGEREPVRGWTGLWVLLPTAGGYVLFLIGAVALGASSSTATGEPSDGAFVGFAALGLLWLVGSITGAVIWFVRTSGALNRYWESLSRA